LQEQKDLIFDLYFTCRIPPFMQDAMGIVIAETNRQQSVFSDAMLLEKMTGIRASATFNNISVPPTDENLEIFVENLKPLYHAGLRSMTIPHTLWLVNGVIQDTFPEMVIKNTVLRRVRTAQEFWLAAEAGFDLINLDRILMRDNKSLKEIKSAQIKFADKTGRYVYTSILANESCLGKCPVMDEHHFVNSTLGCGTPYTPYFKQKISRCCPRLQKKSLPVFLFKRANIPYFREDVDELLANVDVIKMHGRHSPQLFIESMGFIKNYAKGSGEVLAGDNDFLKRAITELNISANQVEAWRRMIKNCKFECWNCNFCENLVNTARERSNRKMEICNSEQVHSQ
jgi:hypothetical protein